MKENTRSLHSAYSNQRTNLDNPVTYIDVRCAAAPHHTALQQGVHSAKQGGDSVARLPPAGERQGLRVRPPRCDAKGQACRRARAAVQYHLQGRYRRVLQGGEWGGVLIAVRGGGGEGGGCAFSPLVVCAIGMRRSILLTLLCSTLPAVIVFCSFWLTLFCCALRCSIRSVDVLCFWHPLVPWCFCLIRAPGLRQR